MSASNSESSPWLLERFFEALERHYAALPTGEGCALGVGERIRAERLLRLPGVWSWYRLREGLRCLLTHSDAQSRAFDLAFGEAFPVSGEQLTREYTGELLQEYLRTFSTHSSIPPPRLDVARSENGQKPSQPPYSRSRVRTRWILACAAMCSVSLGVIEWAVRRTPDPLPHRATEGLTHASGSDSPPASRHEGKGGEPGLPDDLLRGFRGHPHPDWINVRIEESSSLKVVWLGVIGVGLLGLIIVLYRLKRRALPKPRPPVLSKGASRAGLVLEPPVRLHDVPCVGADQLDRLAQAIGVVLDPEAAPTPDVALSVRATARHGGLPCVICVPPRRLRRVLILWDRGSASLQQRPVHRELATGLRARGLPVAVAEYAHELTWLRFDGNAQATSVFRASEQESNSIVLVVGEPGAVTNLADVIAAGLRFHCIAWVQPCDPAIWDNATYEIARRIALFSAGPEGLTELSLWITRGIYEPPPARVLHNWQPSWQDELCTSVRVLDGSEIRRVEATLGAALPWAAVLAACPAPFTAKYAEWIRRELSTTREFEAHAPSPMHLDRVRLLASVQADGWVFDIAVRHCLWWQVLAQRWPELHRSALRIHEQGLAATRCEPGSVSELERDAARALLRWVRLTSASLCPELSRHERERELALAAGEVRDLRSGGRFAQWLSTWLLASTGPRGDQFLLPRVQLPLAVDIRTRRLVLAAERGEDGSVWSPAYRWGVAGLGVVCLLGVIGNRLDESTTRSRLRVGADSGITDIEWRAAESIWNCEETTLQGLWRCLGRSRESLLKVRARGRVFQFPVPEGSKTITLLATASDATESKGCLDEDSFPGALALRCVPGGLPDVSDDGGTTASVVLGRDVANGVPFRDDPDRIRVARWLLASGSADLILIPTEFGQFTLTPWATQLRNELLPAVRQLPFVSTVDIDLQGHTILWSVLNEGGATAWASKKHRRLQAFALPDPADRGLLRLVANRVRTESVDMQVGGQSILLKPLPSERVDVICSDASDCTWSAWYETDPSVGASRIPDITGRNNEVWYLARGSWSVLVNAPGHARTSVPTSKEVTNVRNENHWILAPTTESDPPNPERRSPQPAVESRPISSMDCRTSVECAVQGRCSFRDGQCRADTEEDCRASAECAVQGRCSLHDGQCRADTEEDCRASINCTVQGQCAPSAGVCTAVDCAQSEVCIYLGRCSVRDGACIASPEGCLRSAACVHARQCVARNGECVAAPDACSDSRMCSELGQCTNQSGKCLAQSDQDCRESQICRHMGQCSAVNGECIALSDNDCQNSKVCRGMNQCAARGKKCLAATPEDCGTSFACHEWGKCTLERGTCVVASDDDCRSSLRCDESGRCSEHKGMCLAMQNADCAESKACLDRGRCSAREGECVVGYDRDCKKSTACSREGRCSAWGNVCIGQRDIEILQPCGGACKLHGRCTLQDRKCIATAADCRKSEICRENGLCSLQSGECVAATADDCRDSSTCVEWGACAVRGGKCVAEGEIKCRITRWCTEYGQCVARGSSCVAIREYDCERSIRCSTMGLCSLGNGKCVSKGD